MIIYFQTLVVPYDSAFQAEEYDKDVDDNCKYSQKK